MAPPVAVSRKRFLLLAALFTAPAAGVLGALVLARLIAWPVGLLGLGVAFVGSLIVMAAFWRDTRRLSDYLRRLETADLPPTRPVLSTDLGRTLATVLDRLALRWQAREHDRTRELTMASGIVSGLDDPVLVLTPDRTILNANPAAVDRFAGAPVGRDITAMVRNPQLLAAIEETLKDGQPRTVEYAQRLAMEITFEVRLKPFPVSRIDGGDDRPALILSFHDITRIRRSEQMRADFVANASHELRTPLSSLVGFLETLRGPARDDPAARDRFLDIMTDQAGRMARLIEDLLSLSRIELDEHLPPTGRVNVTRLVQSAADVMAMKADARNIEIVVHTAHDLPPVVGDADQVQQVLHNLVDNAIKYGRADSQVTIRAGLGPPLRGSNRPTVSVAIADRGEGIERSHLPRLTERFYRVDPARSRAIGGTGLGLAIVKHIVNRHRGRLAIDSVLGEGTTVTVTLPAAEASRDPAPLPTRPPSDAALPPTGTRDGTAASPPDSAAAE